MAHCNEMKKGDVYVCGGCGLELEVKTECNHAGASECCDSCADDTADCSFSCCGTPMTKK